MADKPKKPKAAEGPPADADQEAAAAAPLPPAPGPASVPAKASCLTFIVLLLSVAIVLAIAWLNDKLERNTLVWLAVVLFLVIIIPIVVYRAVALWMFDESSRYPDIAEAWRSGMAELARHGMSLSSAPLFLVIGTGNDKLRRNFVSAARGEFFVEGVPDPPAPFYWYANEEGIFLYLNDISWMNAAIALYELNLEAMKSGRLLPGDQPPRATAPRKHARALGTLMPIVRAVPAPEPAPSPGLPSDSVPTDGPGPSAAVPAAAENPAPARLAAKSAARSYMGTLTPDQMLAQDVQAGPQVVAPAPRAASAGGKRFSNRLTSQESSQQLQRLEHLCGLLRRQRHPLCPANGILTLLPFDMLKAGEQDVAELERAVAADLATIYSELQLRCPVTAVVVGMEQEKGFRELIRRVGPEAAAEQRFGRKLDIRTPATVDELRKFTTHVCGTFEDWVYTLFRDDQALSHPGNTALYAMLCKVRRTLKTRLGDVLSKGFGHDRQSENVPVLFSGCYFAATGPKSDRQAFVRDLLRKLCDEQEDIEWTDDALREDHRRGWWTTIGWLLCGAILVGAAGWYFWPSAAQEP